VEAEGALPIGNPRWKLFNMIQIIIATDESTHFSEFADSLSAKNNVSIGWADSPDALVKDAENISPQLIIIDETLGGIEGLDLSRKVILANALVNIALVSKLSEQDFHEAAEGLGILSQLPSCPGASHAKMLLEDLLKVLPVKAGGKK
jgi:DNA-binding NarL/FixJ family response regulator